MFNPAIRPVQTIPGVDHWLWELPIAFAGWSVLHPVHAPEPSLRVEHPRRTDHDTTRNVYNVRCPRSNHAHSCGAFTLGAYSLVVHPNINDGGRPYTNRATRIAAALLRASIYTWVVVSHSN